MTAGVLLLTVAGLLIAGGVVGVVAAARGVELFPQRAGGGSRNGRRGFRFMPIHLAALAAGVAVLLLTGWPVGAIAAVAAALFLPKVLGGGRRPSGSSESPRRWPTGRGGWRI